MNAMYSASEPLETFLVIDMGSSSVRCAAYEVKRNRVIEESRIQLKQRLLDNEGATDADLVCTLVDNAIESCLAILRNTMGPSSFRVKAIGISCFAMSLVGCDESFNAVTPVFTYASRQREHFDPSAEDAEAHFHKTGTVLKHPSYAISHLRIRSQFNNTIVSKWHTLSSLIVSRWRGRITPISYSEASWLGIFDFKKLRWDPKSLLLADINPSSLPPLADFDEEPSHPMQPAYAEKWPEIIDAKIFLGIGDGAAATVGSRYYEGHAPIYNVTYV
jgi:gluconokinase